MIPFWAWEHQNILLIDSIGVVSDSIQVNENKLLALRTQKVIFYSKIVFWIIIGAGLVSILLIMYSLITFNMESQAKKKGNHSGGDLSRPIGEKG